ncbi:PSP1 domain-containing protein [Aequorivita viscosa]|uniref:Cell fate regulator YaaT, PSP1 superfamily (Controls sporulation, competence, biofilm development) n=1 Tax=Aequorivita viscosa TaxID=797419 RepID=A0A1M6DNR7_9FLAO|nr:regulatory iron-sulfur-containing complex subunit RicT [Aequorivita viscosa]SDW50630.1 Cell fate regulator YaaT, PSP1 superfamily (controls sporulation, competence, biofilm development) [Aequorivita viscosa]SHI74871.1 Cell fate regulator YaaT, PSP1 superfamily (controls sporulation, competence, biofilm development) [Aequorivita viscosa]
MGCNSCASSTGGQPKGCKNNGTCGTDGCNKLTVFDWLSNMSLPASMEPFNAVEVRFKNGRKEFFQNPENLTLSIGDIVATETSPGHDIGIITLTGELVRVQMKKKRIPLKIEALPKIYRKASQKDIDIWQSYRERESSVQKRSREIAIRLGLQMKISDVEFQGDGSKVIFYYTADERVDFRELIKEFARTFNSRIEMKQVGFRQEAARLGGIGSCGRELCCSTWLTDFRSVNTTAARYQQLSLNPQKLAGQCGKLKCCLNYELDTYLEALESFPNTETKLQTEKGTASCQKIDIFKGRLWYAYEKEGMNWHELSAEKANHIIEQNKIGKKPMALEEFAVEIPNPEKTPFNDVVGQDSLTRFDQPKQKGKSRRNKSRNKSKSKNAVTATPAASPAKKRPRKSNKNRKPNKPNKPNKNE